MWKWKQLHKTMVIPVGSIPEEGKEGSRDTDDATSSVEDPAEPSHRSISVAPSPSHTRFRTLSPPPSPARTRSHGKAKRTNVREPFY